MGGDGEWLLDGLGGGGGMMENGYYVCIHKQFRFN